MLKGLYAAASAMISGLNRQTVLSHNVANLDTPGFKQIMITMDDFWETAVVPPQTNAQSLPIVPSIYQQMGLNRLSYVGDLGLGVENPPQVTDFSQGPLLNTNQPLDIAFQGPGFFRVRTPDGEQYTRDGRFQRDSANNLVTIDGFNVLNEAGDPIVLPEGTAVAVGSDGTIAVDGTAADKIGLVSFLDPSTELTRAGSNNFAAANPPSGTELGTLQQGSVEGANVNISQLMVQMISVARSYEAAQQMVTVQDSLLGKAIASLGRF